MSSTAARQISERRRGAWTHPSALALSPDTNPVDAIAHIARNAVFAAIQSGWSGPPYDPFALAEFLKISVEPRQDVIDARTTSEPGGRFRIEYNPNRSPARINFSVAHEIAHTLFPDCGEATRNRYTHAVMSENDWELEVLCNLGAAEILMPVGSFALPDNEATTIDMVSELQRRFRVSTEAVLLRIARLTTNRCFVFAAHMDEKSASPRYVIEYAARSRTWPVTITKAFRLPANTVIAQCKAIGYTAKSDEEWITSQGKWHVECLGIAPFPGYTYPRVVGIVRPLDATVVQSERTQYLRGDATEPRGGGPRLIAHVINDKAISWRGSFANAVRKRWPEAQKDFTDWVFSHKAEFHLGAVRYANLGESLELASLVAQHGYGPSLFPRIQYSALEACLANVAARAHETGATVHMPRIGCGEAGGDWRIVSELIDETLSSAGIQVTVYDLPVAPQQDARAAVQ